MVIAFLVHPDYVLNAKLLAMNRLGKQRVEAKQLIDAITAFKAGNPNPSWINHPAARSWINNLDSLKLYFNAVVSEWVSRGYKNNYELYTDIDPNAEPPYWMDCPAVHYSHIAQLMQKDNFYYCKENLADKIPAKLLDYFNSMPAEYKSYGYIWPYKHTREELLTLPLAQIAEPYADRPICRGAYKDGKVCRNKAIIQDLYCRLHVPADLPPPVLCAACYKSGDACRNKAKDNGYCGVHKKQAPSS